MLKKMVTDQGGYRDIAEEMFRESPEHAELIALLKKRSEASAENILAMQASEIEQKPYLQEAIALVNMLTNVPVPSRLNKFDQDRTIWEQFCNIMKKHLPLVFGKIQFYVYFPKQEDLDQKSDVKPQVDRDFSLGISEKDLESTANFCRTMYANITRDTALLEDQRNSGQPFLTQVENPGDTMLIPIMNGADYNRGVVVIFRDKVFERVDLEKASRFQSILYEVWRDLQQKTGE